MNNYFVFLLTIFLLGAFTQAALLIRRLISSQKLLMLLALGAAGLLLINLFSFASRLLVVAIAASWFVYFVVTLPLILKLEILPVISRRTLPALTVIFWYMYLQFFQNFAVNNLALTYIAVIFSAAIFVLCISDRPPHNFWRGLAYAWFLIIIIMATASQINFGVYGYFLYPSFMAIPGTYEVFIAGMAAFYLALQLWNALHLLPLSLADKKRSTGLALWEWRTHLKIFSFKYHHEPALIPLEAMLIAAATALILWLNNYYAWLPNLALADTLLVLIVSLSPQTTWAYN